MHNTVFYINIAYEDFAFVTHIRFVGVSGSCKALLNMQDVIQWALKNWHTTQTFTAHILFNVWRWNASKAVVWRHGAPPVMQCCWLLNRRQETVIEAQSENLWRATLHGWVTAPLAIIFPEMDSRLDADYHGARLLSRVLSSEKKKKHWRETGGRKSEPANL